MADPAFVLGSPEPIPEVVEPYVVISARPWKNSDLQKNYMCIAKFINWMWKKHKLKSVLVPFQIVRDNDLEQLKIIRDLMMTLPDYEAEGEPTLFSYTSDYMKVMELMSRCTAVVGMRLHSLIFSTLVATPFLALSYSDKVRQFAGQASMEEYCLDWAQLDYDDLVKRFESLLDDRENIVTNLEETVLKMRAKALEHEDILKELLL